MIGALLVAAIVAAYPTPEDRLEVVRLIDAADDDFAGGDHEPDATRAALGRHVARLLDEARRRGLAYEHDAAARRDVAAEAPEARPGYPRPLDDRLSKLSVHAGKLLKILDRPEAPETR